MSSANRTDTARHPGMVNKWTRDDLPSISDLCQADDERGNGERTVTLAIALDAVVDRLNKDFPKSYDRGGLRGSTWLERERDMWRNSYGIAAAHLEQVEKAERDEWKARAVAAEARTTPAVTEAEIAAARREGQAEAWDEGYRAGSQDMSDLRAGRLTFQAITSNPYRNGEDRHVDQ